MSKRLSMLISTLIGQYGSVGLERELENLLRSKRREFKGLAMYDRDEVPSFHDVERHLEMGGGIAFVGLRGLRGVLLPRSPRLALISIISDRMPSLIPLFSELQIPEVKKSLPERDEWKNILRRKTEQAQRAGFNGKGGNQSKSQSWGRKPLLMRRQGRLR